MHQDTSLVCFLIMLQVYFGEGFLNLVVVLSPTVTGGNSPGRSANTLAVSAPDNEGLIRAGGFIQCTFFYEHYSCKENYVQQFG